MKQKLKTALILGLGFFILLQFWRGPDIQVEAEPTENDFLLNAAQLETKTIQYLKAACYDCHSMNTKIPWYGYVSPPSRLVREHIKNGRHSTNFSDWGEMDLYSQIETLEVVIKEIAKEKMPLSSYLKWHPEARIEEEARQNVIADLKALLTNYQQTYQSKK